MCLNLRKSYRRFVGFDKKSFFWQKLQKQGKVICWKIYQKRINYLRSYWDRQLVTEPGNVVSDRLNKKINQFEKEYGMIERGIHVYISKPGNLSPWRVIPVICRKENFVAMNSTEAVFMKVEITKKTWNKIFKEKK